MSAALSDQALQDLLEALFEAPAILKCAALSAIAAGLYRWGIVRRRQAPDKVYRNEAILFLAVLVQVRLIVNSIRHVYMSDR